MKNLKFFCIITLAGSMLISGCKKNDKRSRGVAQNASEFTSMYGPKMQTIDFNVSELPKTFTLEGGTKVTIPQAALTQNRVPINGPVTLEACEVLKRSQVLLIGGNTNHMTGAPLSSDGFIYLNAKAAGSYLDHRLHVPIKIEIPTSREGTTQLWQGNTEADGNQLEWRPLRQFETVSIPTTITENNGKFGFNWAIFGWVNCDIFYGSANPKTTLTVELINNEGKMAGFRGADGDTFVFFCPKGANVAVQLYTSAGTNKVKSFDNVMPIGLDGRLLAYTIKDGNYFFAKKDITISENLSESLSLSETSEKLILKEINQLDNY